MDGGELLTSLVLDVLGGASSSQIWIDIDICFCSTQVLSVCLQW